MKETQKMEENQHPQPLVEKVTFKEDTPYKDEFNQYEELWKHKKMQRA